MNVTDLLLFNNRMCVMLTPVFYLVEFKHKEVNILK
jgi:hypothetical protein